MKIIDDVSDFSEADYEYLMPNVGLMTQIIETASEYRGHRALVWVQLSALRDERWPLRWFGAIV